VPPQGTTPAAPTTPFLDPAQSVLIAVDPYQLPDAIAAAVAAAATITPPLLPISTATAATLLPGVSIRGSSTLHATAPPPLALPPSGGFNGASRFETFLLRETAPEPVTHGGIAIPVTSRTPLLTPVTGGRSQASVTSRGGEGIGVSTPFGHLSISRGDYVFGSTRYPLASARGVLTTVLLALAVLAGIAALLGAIAAADRLLGGSGRYGSQRTREDLYAAARRKNIPGRSRMSKAELRRALDDH
jgi:hypothetical protein